MKMSVSVAVAMALALAARATAQMGVVIPSAELLAAEADVIVRARVGEVRREPPHMPDNRQFRWIVVTLDVAETIKGPGAKTVQFAEMTLDFDRRNEGYREAGLVPLWFLSRGKDAGHGRPGGDALYTLVHFDRMGPRIAAERNFKDTSEPILTMKTLDGVSGPGLVAAVKAALAEGGGGPARGHSIDIGRAIMARARPPGDANRVDVPVDARLETLARALVRDPRSFLTRPNDKPRPPVEPGREAVEAYNRAFEEASMRVQGIEALRYFRSDANIALLRPLLADSHLQDITRWGKDGLPYTDGREYPVRKAAVDVLKGWGVAVAEPVLTLPPEPKGPRP